MFSWVNGCHEWDYTSPSPLQLAMTVWLNSSQWYISQSDTYHFFLSFPVFAECGIKARAGVAIFDKKMALGLETMPNGAIR